LPQFIRPYWFMTLSLTAAMLTSKSLTNGIQLCAINNHSLEKMKLKVLQGSSWMVLHAWRASALCCHLWRVWQVVELCCSTVLHAWRASALCCHLWRVWQVVELGCTHYVPVHCPVICNICDKWLNCAAHMTCQHAVLSSATSGTCVTSSWTVLHAWLASTHTNRQTLLKIRALQVCNRANTKYNT